MAEAWEGSGTAQMFLAVDFEPRLGARPGDTVTYDEATGEIVLVRRATCSPGDVAEWVLKQRLVTLAELGWRNGGTS